MARRSWLIVLIALMSGLLAVLGGLVTGTSGAEASARVGLTSTSEWPLYQADLESFGNIVQRPEIVESVRSEVGADRLDVEVEIVEGLFVTEVTVRADENDAALEATRLLVDKAVGLQAAEADGARVEELEQLRDEIVDARADVEELVDLEANARVEARELARSVDEEYSFEAEALYRDANASASQLGGQLGSAEQRVRDLASRISQLELRLGLPSDRLYVISDPATVEGPNPLDGPLPVALAAGFGAVAAAALIVARDRANGPVRTAGQLESVLGATILADLSRPRGATGSERLNHALARVGPEAEVAVLPGNGSARVEFDLLRRLSDEVSGGPAPIDQLARIAPSPQEGFEHALLAVTRNSTSIDSVRKRLELLEIGGKNVIGVVVL